MSEPRLPKKLYRVTRSGGEVHYLSPGGKTFADLPAARSHAGKIRQDGAVSRIFVCEPEWTEVTDA